jgi:sorting nexin-8
MPHFRLPLPPVLRVSSPLATSTPYSTDSAVAADSSSILGLPVPVALSSFRDATATAQADLSRLTNTLKTLVEMNGQCWKGQDCELSDGVRQGVNVVSAHTQRHTDLLELRVCSSAFPALIASFYFVVLTGFRGDYCVY